MDLLSRIKEEFRQTYEEEPEFVIRAPGRVNLLGEHIDYNDGWVLPIAIDIAAYLAVSKDKSGLISVSAADLGEKVTFKEEKAESLPGWARYPAGVAWVLRNKGLKVHGMKALLRSEIPMGSGLSSSAAVEVAFATAWQKLGGWLLPPLELALACQQAENSYVGVGCGIMDQFASICGIQGKALLLDCRTLEWENLTLPKEVGIVVADTGVRRKLGDSEYNLRKSQCEEAVKILKSFLPEIKSLRDVSEKDLDKYGHKLSDIVHKRARHVVEECVRVKKAADVLKKGDAISFGRLINECHISLRDLYEVSCPELDIMVSAAQAIDGCFGARLTGAGFGGCTVNMVALSEVSQFKRKLKKKYEEKTGRECKIYVCQASDGAKVM